MGDKKARFSAGTYNDTPNPRIGAAASAGLASSIGQNGATGPATSIGLEFPAYVPAVTGQLLITAFIHVVDATPAEAVAFRLTVNGTDVALWTEIGDSAGNAGASFAVLVPAVAGVAQDIVLNASAAHALTSAAKHQALNVVNIP